MLDYMSIQKDSKDMSLVELLVSVSEVSAHLADLLTRYEAANGKPVDWFSSESGRS